MVTYRCNYNINRIFNPLIMWDILNPYHWNASMRATNLFKGAILKASFAYHYIFISYHYVVLHQINFKVTKTPTQDRLRHCLAWKTKFNSYTQEKKLTNSKLGKHNLFNILINNVFLFRIVYNV